MKRAKGSTMNAPSKSSIRPAPSAIAMMAATMTRIDSHMICVDTTLVSGRNTPSMSSVMAPTARISSGSSGA